MHWLYALKFYTQVQFLLWDNSFPQRQFACMSKPFFPHCCQASIKK